MDNFSIEEFPVQADERSIFSVLYLPNGASSRKRCPAIVFGHGLASNHESGDAYARELAKRGYAVCCLDFCGGKDSKSSGDAMDLTLFSASRDMSAVYDALAKRPDIDANNVFLMGASMGGAAASLSASARAQVIKGLILLYPAFSLADEVKKIAVNPDDLPETYDFGATVGHEFLKTLHGFDALMAAGVYHGPVIILHGTADERVPSSYSMQAARAYPHADLKLIDGAGHGFTGGLFKYAVRTIVEFLDEECDLADESGLEGDLNVPSGMGGFAGMGAQD